MFKKENNSLAFLFIRNNKKCQPIIIYTHINNMNQQKYWRNTRKDNNSANKLTIVLFVIYFIALFWILLFKLGVQFSYMENRQVNLIPFREALMLNGKIDFW